MAIRDFLSVELHLKEWFEMARAVCKYACMTTNRYMYINKVFTLDFLGLVELGAD